MSQLHIYAVVDHLRAGDDGVCGVVGRVQVGDEALYAVRALVEHGQGRRAGGKAGKGLLPLAALPRQEAEKRVAICGKPADGDRWAEGIAV